MDIRDGQNYENATKTLRDLIDKWMRELRNLPFGIQMERIHGWLRGMPTHLTGLNLPINQKEAERIVYDYFHDSNAEFWLECY